ncbi:hypothetical protein E5E91_00930 [Deinococcus radiodurans R1 = ATCC 13939 = DSM 20539]|uniref:Uncharacterized protein n=1 Tax=Deinococcus radiodurans (strain ATCC 13939 / DSM 20539 / JCM 16871 / CCUG 27074 / LMG 4051 / NBRC 15346 / NCIMB 9279 / VKM B-1422 / R1) TaxID=243230 RepID=Q9RXX4_DEIRA|nr:hypothetical protein DR_0181 [Deinococcus radiodurans R1 = ATCC 13939 = DSM 20539]QEM72146.1 hypothetical protein DXG80_10525 [Deinococcus radiodurans]UDK99381.1 hypothetical protein E5E91_00930 [Deinococcus radiodurans R1 = ATCC 13939 = DSM 20539]HCE64998.1 hypothetical protein [Deinococcus radiodurans]
MLSALSLYQNPKWSRTPTVSNTGKGETQLQRASPKVTPFISSVGSSKSQVRQYKSFSLSGFRRGHSQRPAAVSHSSAKAQFSSSGRTKMCGVVLLMSESVSAGQGKPFACCTSSPRGRPETR